MANLLAFHLIAVVCWFAGLLYTGRLLIYALEAQERPDHECMLLQQQYALMKKRLWYGITTPAMLITVTLGIILMLRTGVHHVPWFILKMTLVVLLLVYHFCCQVLLTQQKRGTYRFTSSKLRLWNEIGTLFLIFIVVLAKHKDIPPALFTTGISVVALAALFLLIKKLRRQKN